MKKMNADYYVLLTGARGNSGDDLIRHSAIKLFQIYRPDRQIITFPSWEKFDSARLSVINQSKALILCGGPSIRMNTFGDVYKLTDDLNDIKVPIIALGVGYRDSNGEWENTSRFELSEKTKLLLSKINYNGYLSSVRCYHTLNVLNAHGFDNFLMSGCPAFYNIEEIDKIFITPKLNDENQYKVSFTTGRRYATSPGMDEQQKQIISSLNKNEMYDLTVAFHDPIDLKNKYTEELIQFLEKNQIKIQDVSKSSEKLIEFHSQFDFHIGYRVHAHIFMSSIKKPSLLLSEDGRGKGIKSALPGIILNAYQFKKLSFVQRLTNKIIKTYFPSSIPISDLSEDIERQLKIEINQGWKRSLITADSIKHHLENMKRTMLQLP
jgi:hypothetical protein